MNLSDYPGTRWYKCDLHLHTLASKCFEDDDYSPEAFIDAVSAKGLDCIAITDHNTGKSIDAIKDAARDKNITVFPGVEITCTDAKVHILVLFNPEKTTQDVEDFLISLGLDRQKFGAQNAHIDKTITKIMEIIERNEAIAIPAHIDEYNGLSSIADAVKQELFGNGLISSVQIVHSRLMKESLSGEEETELIDYLNEYYGKTEIGFRDLNTWRSCSKYIKSIAQLTFSDNPKETKSSKHGLWGVGNKYTWIKMGKSPDLDSLKQAFLVPDLRVRNMFSCQYKPYQEPKTWIESISINDTYITECGKGFSLSFSPQMNTIIGGRGSGKSSILRFIRGILKKTNDLSSLTEVGEEFQNFYQKQDSHQHGVFNGKSQITLNLFKNGISYQIVAENITDVHNQKISISKFDFETREYIEIVQEEFLSLFEVNIFSQKQIYEIANNPNALLTIIDESIDGLESKKAEISQLKSDYYVISSEIRSYKEKIKNIKLIESEIDEIDSRIKLLQKSGITDLLELSQQYSKESTYLSRFLTKIDEEVKSFNHLLEKLKLVVEFDETVLKTSNKDSIIAIKDNLNNSTFKIIERITSLKDEYVGNVEKAKEAIKTSGWSTFRQLNLDQIEIKKRDLGDQAIKNIEEIGALVEEKHSKEKERDVIRKYEADIKLKEKDLEMNYLEYLKAINEVSECRKDFLRESVSGDNVRISVAPFRDKKMFEKEFRSIINNETAFHDSIETLMQKCFDGRLPDTLKIIHEDLHQLRVGEIPENYDGRFKNCIQRLSPDQFDSLILLVPDDEIKAEYKPPRSKTFKKISSASAGQKTATILTFLLSFGNEPLILDQPEDDLDNHLVYGLIVDRLKESKESRQVIVVTHNANIPVNGDSEYIIAMDSESLNLNVLHEGSIDEDNIKKEICDVMEGGEDAFRLRSKRYEINK